ncbi:MAG: thiamine pyrophosphate-binding protein [Kiritimatiellae bacterium]|nr:thiamine pyrophosphate-binding protein [Kiritimatiellia bacterium]
MKLSDYVADFLSKHTRHAFVGNGGCVVHVLDSIDKHKALKCIPCQNEQGASIAAEAYTRVSGKIGVAIATSGPGMINLMQGIACAYYDSIPTLFISGASPTAQLKGDSKVRQIGFQEMDVAGIVSPLAKYAVLITNPKKIRYELEKLIYTAYEGRPGPVMLDLPDDLQRAEVDPAQLEHFVAPKQDYKIDTVLVDEMLRLIKEANRPVVIAGGGIKLANAQRLCRNFLNKTEIPYASTWATIDMFLDNEPCLIGNFGISANRAGNFAVQNADLIISLGCRLDTHQTGSKAALFAPRAKKVMVDIDAYELNKKNGMQIDVKIQCDLKTFFTQINKMVIKIKDLSTWKARISKWRRSYPACPLENYKQSRKVNPYVFMNELSKQPQRDSVVITDTGATLTWTMQGYKIRYPQMLFSAFNHSPMGYALPASIGAQFAAPKRRVVCIIGDGGMQMNVQELETVEHNDLPIKIFVIDNGEYGIIKQTQDTWLNSRYVASDPSSGLGFPDICRVAKAYGIKTITIKTHKELVKQIRYALNYKGPILCDVKLKSGEKIIPKLEFGRPLEDLSPFLPKEELAENMLP